MATTDVEQWTALKGDEPYVTPYWDDRAAQRARARPTDAYQLVLDANGELVDVRRPGSGDLPRRLEMAKATIYYSSSWVPTHVCYDDTRLNHPDDRIFCRRFEGVTQ